MNANPFVEALLKAAVEAASQAAVKGGAKLFEYLSKKICNQLRSQQSLNALTQLGISALRVDSAQSPALA